jgi:hypothetical protein
MLAMMPGLTIKLEEEPDIMKPYQKWDDAEWITGYIESVDTGYLE